MLLHCFPIQQHQWNPCTVTSNGYADSLLTFLQLPHWQTGVLPARFNGRQHRVSLPEGRVLGVAMLD